MNAHRDPDRLIHAFLMEGETELADQVFDAVRDRIEQKRQRVVIGPWRMPAMNKMLTIGLAAAAAVVVAVVVGTQLLGSPNGGLGGDSTPSPEPTAEPTPEPTQSPPAEGGLPEGPFVVTGTDDPVQVTVNIASSGWNPLRDFDAVDKADDGLDPPEYAGGLLVAWGWPAGTEFSVYGDACQ